MNEAVMEGGQVSEVAQSAAGRKVVRKTLEERIAEAHAALRSLEEEKRKRDAAEKAENEKAVRKLLVGEGLLGLSVETWRAALPAVKAALGQGSVA